MVGRARLVMKRRLKMVKLRDFLSQVQKEYWLVEDPVKTNSINKISRRGEAGASLVEYSLLVALLSIASVASLAILGKSAENKIFQVAFYTAFAGESEYQDLMQDGAAMGGGTNVWGDYFGTGAPGSEFGRDQGGGTNVWGPEGRAHREGGGTDTWDPIGSEDDPFAMSGFILGDNSDSHGDGSGASTQTE